MPTGRVAVGPRCSWLTEPGPQQLKAGQRLSRRGKLGACAREEVGAGTGWSVTNANILPGSAVPLCRGFSSALDDAQEASQEPLASPSALQRESISGSASLWHLSWSLPVWGSPAKLLLEGSLLSWATRPLQQHLMGCSPPLRCFPICPGACLCVSIPHHPVLNKQDFALLSRCFSWEVKLQLEAKHLGLQSPVLVAGMCSQVGQRYPFLLGGSDGGSWADPLPRVEAKRHLQPIGNTLV